MNRKIKYQSCDAEKIGQIFEENKFDLIFSSNMMEHLPDPNSCLDGGRLMYRLR